MADGTALIVGGRGFIGAHVTRAFVRAGWTAATFGPGMAVDLLSDLAGHVPHIEGSIEDEAAVAAAMGRVAPSVVVSLAAYSAGAIGLAKSGETDLERAIAVNALGLGRLLEACRDQGVTRVVWASSTVVFGPKRLYGEAPVDETAPRHPVTGYGLSKVLAEDIAQYHRDRYGLDLAGLRLPLVFGPGCWYKGVAGQLVDLFRHVHDGRPARVEAAPGPVDLAYVEDAARAFLALATHDRPLQAVYHLKGFAAAFAEIADELRARRPEAEIEVTDQGPAIDYPSVDATRITRDIGFRPRYDLAAAVDAHLAALEGRGA